MNKAFQKPMKIGSYSEEDVFFLLKDLSSYDLEGSTLMREKAVQSGGHYSESLPTEYSPPSEYMDLFRETTETFKKKMALNIGIVAEKILRRNGNDMVLVSLARAGTPIGALIRRYLLHFYNLSVPHYSISIIRGKGFDYNAIQYILNRHKGSHIQFVDGWTGKGAITKELINSCHIFYKNYGVKLDDSLAVVADPGYCSNLYGTREDFLIPSACLNSTVSGLVSRTVLNEQYIGPDDFHGAKYYKNFSSVDVSNEFLNIISQQFQSIQREVLKEYLQKEAESNELTFAGLTDVEKIMSEYEIDNINFVKPGVGETTRVLLRRVPWKILIKDMNSPYVKHILMLAIEKEVPVEHYPNMNYTACGLIKRLS
jgi:hypothetical protein